MQFMDKKRKKIHKTSVKLYLFSLKSLTVCLSFFVFIVLISSDRSLFQTVSFKPSLKVQSFSILPRLLARESFDITRRRFVVEDTVLLPDHLLLLLSDRIRVTEQLECVYYRLVNVSDDDKAEPLLLKRAISIEDYHDYKSVVRCEIPPVNYSVAVDLRLPDEGFLRVNQTAVVPLWSRVVYEAVLDSNTAVVFVKGLNLIPHRGSNPSRLRCHFALNKFGKDEFVFTTKAIAAAQEVVRCLLPRSFRNYTEKAEGIRVTVGRVDDPVGAIDSPLPAVAKIYGYKLMVKKEKHELCACTMLWNQASFMREWVMYHAWLGVERWFIYDNNSDDVIQDVIDELNSQSYNVSRHVWPWIKAQEAGFSHCALRAKRECKWVGFFDVDEFFYFPPHRGQHISGQNSLRALVANYTDSPTYAEIRTICHSFGPSGLTTAPVQGVTVGYTCRLQAPERHKSIVRPELLDKTLLNAVHHFRLRGGYKYLNMPESTAVVNHYKYQVWDIFKAKFFRRVSTYVVNWQEDQNKGSKDRAPGLGTQAIEPPNWRRRFCEVWDTGLKDFVLANFADPKTGFFPWERSHL